MMRLLILAVVALALAGAVAVTVPRAADAALGLLVAHSDWHIG